MTSQTATSYLIAVTMKDLICTTNLPPNAAIPTLEVYLNPGVQIPVPTLVSPRRNEGVLSGLHLRDGSFWAMPKHVKHLPRSKMSNVATTPNPPKRQVWLPSKKDHISLNPPLVV